MSEAVWKDFDEHREDYDLIEFEEFFALAMNEGWDDGPWKDGFGDGYGHPHVPNRECWGTLTSGRKVRSRS